MLPPIFTQRLELRAWTPELLPAFAALNADPRVMEYFPAALSLDATARLLERLSQHLAAHGFGVLAVLHREQQACIGCVGVQFVDARLPIAPAVELVWRLGAGYWGQGYACEAVHAVLGVWQEQLRPHALVAFTASTNSRSRRVMEKLGMSHSAADDFAHPSLSEEHPLSRHVVYRLDPERPGQFPTAAGNSW